MKKAIHFILMVSIVLVMFSGFNSEDAYAENTHSCSCCASNGCHKNSKCNDSIKGCICRTQCSVRVQVPLSKNSVLPSPIFREYLASNPHFSYFRFSSDDIFHPPRFF